MTGRSRKSLVKSPTPPLPERNKYFDKFLHDSNFRLLVTTIIGGVWNFIYAVYHILLGVVFSSHWLLTMGVYYLVVCGMRFSALSLRAHKENGNAGWKALRRNAILTFVLAVVFAVIVSLTVIENHNQVYNKIVAISMAVYTAYYVVFAIIRLSKLKKDRTIRKIMLRNCSMVAALGSLFGLERVLIGTFGKPDDRFATIIEAASGVAFILLIIGFGVYMRRLSSKVKTTNPPNMSE